MKPLKYPDNLIVAQMKPLNSDPGVESNLHINEITKTLPTIVETKVAISCCNRSLTELKAIDSKQRDRLNSESDINRLRLRKGSEAGSIRASRGEIDKTLPVLLRKDAFYSGSVQNLKEFQSQRSLAAYRNSVASLNRGSNLAIQNNNALAADESDSSQGCRAMLGSLMDVSLLKDWTFMLLAISNLFGEKFFRVFCFNFEKNFLKII